MDQLLSQIEKYKKEIEKFTASDSKEVEEFRIKYLGTKGIVKTIMGEMKNVAAEKKKEFGQVLNDFKLFAESKYESLKESAADSQKSPANTIDLTLARGRYTHRQPSSYYVNAKSHCFNISAIRLCCGRRTGDRRRLAQLYGTESA